VEQVVAFDAAHAAVHNPPDRRVRIWLRPSVLIITAGLAMAMIAAAWIEVGIWGLPDIATVPQVYPNNFAGPHGR
jgi:hypothetical protein